MMEISKKKTNKMFQKFNISNGNLFFFTDLACHFEIFKVYQWLGRPLGSKNVLALFIQQWRFQDFPVGAQPIILKNIC